LQQHLRRYQILKKAIGETGNIINERQMSHSTNEFEWITRCEGSAIGRENAVNILPERIDEIAEADQALAPAAKLWPLSGLLRRILYFALIGRAQVPQIQFVPSEQKKVLISGHPGNDSALTGRLAFLSSKAVPELLFRPSDFLCKGDRNDS
jgi:hypothetical protein